MVRWITTATLLLAAMFIFQRAGAADPYETLSVLRIPKKLAPDFSLPTVNGKTVRLSDYRETVVLLGFFKTF